MLAVASLQLLIPRLEKLLDFCVDCNLLRQAGDLGLEAGDAELGGQLLAGVIHVCVLHVGAYPSQRAHLRRYGMAARIVLAGLAAKGTDSRR